MKSSAQQQSTSTTPTVMQQQRRSDGRMGSGTLRPLSCELSCLHRADGSALWKCGGGAGQSDSSQQSTSASTRMTSTTTTAVMAAVYGPVAPKFARHEQSDGAIVSVILKGATSTTGNSSNTSSNLVVFTAEWQELLTQWLSNAICMEEYPRSVIQIVIQVIQADGSVLSAALHAAVAALLDAGIAMTYLPVATTIAFQYPASPILNEEEQQQQEKINQKDAMEPVLLLLLDPTAEEEIEEEASTIVIVTDSRQHQQQQQTSSSSSTTATSSFLGSCLIRMGSRRCATPTGVGARTTSSPASSHSHRRHPSHLSIHGLQQCIQVAHKASPAVIAFWRLAVEQKCQRQEQTLWVSSLPVS